MRAKPRSRATGAGDFGHCNAIGGGEHGVCGSTADDIVGTGPVVVRPGDAQTRFSMTARRRFIHLRRSSRHIPGRRPSATPPPGIWIRVLLRPLRQWRRPCVIPAHSAPSSDASWPITSSPSVVSRGTRKEAIATASPCCCHSSAPKPANRWTGWPLMISRRRGVLQFLAHLEEERGCSVQTRNQRLAAIRSFARFVASPAGAVLRMRSPSRNFRRRGNRSSAGISHFTS